jgi:Zinc carboxypeptidase
MKKYILLIFSLFFLINNTSYSQNMMNKERFVEQIFQKYDNYKEISLKHRRFKHADLQPLIEQIKQQTSLFSVSSLGKSSEGRNISLVSLGTGKIKILLWSQMHGDEATATMAMFDIFKFFSKSDEFDALKKDLLSKVTLYCIPMLNPDGAEVWKRRTASDIDMNRDALRLQSPESVILKGVRDSLNADFGFNLHDQSILYTVGNTPKPATISFLAPAYNYEKGINEVRGRAMKVIAELTETIEKLMPQQVAKYSDEFEPRAFGDNIQKWGTSVILIESGGYPNDPEKQYIRKMNFIALMAGFYSMANQSYQQYTLEQYNAIPFNERLLKNLIIRNLNLKKEKQTYKADIAYVYNEVSINGSKDFYYKSAIDDIGDLSIFYGYQEIDCAGMTGEEGKVYPQKFDNLEDIKKLNIKDLYKEGYTSVRLENTKITDDFTNLGINILLKTNKIDKKVEMNRNPDIVIRQNDQVRYVVINGFVYDASKGESFIKNALIYK